MAVFAEGNDGPRRREEPEHRWQEEASYPETRPGERDAQVVLGSYCPLSITRIEGGRLEYRGRDATVLAATATLEDVAALLWQVESLPRSRSVGGWPRARAAAGVAEQCIAAMADLAMAGRWTGSQSRS